VAPEHAARRIVELDFLNDSRNLGLSFSRAPIDWSHLYFSRHSAFLTDTATHLRRNDYNQRNQYGYRASVHLVTMRLKLCEQYTDNREQSRGIFKPTIVISLFCLGCNRSDEINLPSWSKSKV
jgi:hypothetical protein